MTLQENIGNILADNYPLEELLELLSNLALQRSSSHKKTMEEAYSLIIPNEEGAQGYVYYTPQSFTFIDGEYQPQESQAEFAILSERLGQLLIENSEDRDYLEGVIYAGDLNIQVTKPSDPNDPPYQRVLDEYDNEYADQNELASWFDSELGVWVLIQCELVLTPGEGFDDMVDEAVEFVATMEEEGYTDGIAGELMQDDSD